MSDIYPIVVPKWGLSMTEGTLVQWNVEVGATVASGDVIADIETEKIVNELEVHADGVLRRQLVSEGTTVPVSALLGIVASESASEEAIDAFVREHIQDESGAASDALPEPAAVVEDRVAAPVASARVDAVAETRVPVALRLDEGASNAGDVNATHMAERFAENWHVDLSKVAGTGRRGRISKSDVQQAIAAAGGSVSNAPVNPPAGAEVRATPLARRLAEKHGVDLATVIGTGARNRITKQDVIAATQTAGATVTEPSAVVRDDDGVEIPLSNTRKVIARRLSESKQTAPHFRVASDIRLDELFALRAQINHDGREQRVSVNDMLIKAVATALVEIPEVNVQYSDGVLRKFEDADVSVAVALDDGLITPIVRAANRKGFGQISREMADLITRAKSSDLRSDEIEGGTFTVSNLGMFGVSAFDAIINQPQAAILAVAAAEKKRVFVDDEEIVALVVRATLSCDHRIVDGALGARFLQYLKQIIEQPGRLLT